MQYQNIEVIQIQNNPQIGGDLSKLNSLGSGFIQKSLTTFIANNCDLSGSLPDNIYFEKLKYFIIHNNRLSCEIPSQLINYKIN